MLDAGSIGPVTTSRSTRTEGGHAIVITRDGAKGVGGADGDGRRLVTGAMYLPVDFLTGAVLAVVTGGGDHNHAGIDQLPDSSANGIVLVRVHRRGTEAHIDYAHVIGRAVGHEPIKRGQGGRHRSRSLRVEHAQVNQLGIRRHAEIGTLTDASVAGRNRRDVSAMAIRIVDAVFTGKVFAVSDAAVTVPVEEGDVSQVHAG